MGGPCWGPPLGAPVLLKGPPKNCLAKRGQDTTAAAAATSAGSARRVSGDSGSPPFEAARDAYEPEGTPPVPPAAAATSSCWLLRLTAEINRIPLRVAASLWVCPCMQCAADPVPKCLLSPLSPLSPPPSALHPRVGQHLSGRRSLAGIPVQQVPAAAAAAAA
ncbi:hypothetical protein ACSSS7_006725 [Eimeria intestinalis]